MPVPAVVLILPGVQGLGGEMCTQKPVINTGKVKASATTPAF